MPGTIGLVISLQRKVGEDLPLKFEIRALRNLDKKESMMWKCKYALITNDQPKNDLIVQK